MKILKYFVSIGFVLGGVKAITEGNLLMAIFFMIAGILIFPQVSEIVKSKFPQWQNKFLRYGTILALLIVGASLKSKADKEKLEASPEFIAEKYFNDNKNIKLIKIADTLLKLDDYFDIDDTKKYDYNKGFSKITDNEVLYKFIDVKKDSLYKDYQNNSDGKYLIDYNLKFSVKQGKVVNVLAIGKYNDGSIKEYPQTSSLTVASLLNTSEINKMKVATAKLEEAMKLNKELQNKRDKFEKECFTGLSGYNLALVKVVEENLHDPESFEHVETKFKLLDDYAVVVMKYRNKNVYNAVVTNVVTAKINYDCEIIEIVE